MCLYVGWANPPTRNLNRKPQGDIFISITSFEQREKTLIAGTNACVARRRKGFFIERGSGRVLYKYLQALVNIFIYYPGRGDEHICYCGGWGDLACILRGSNLLPPPPLHVVLVLLCSHIFFTEHRFSAPKTSFQTS